MEGGARESRRRGRLVGLLLATAAAIALVLVLVLVATGRHGRPPSPRPVGGLPARPAPAGTAYGAAVNDLFNDGPRPAATVRATLAALRDTGATVARADALWEASEPAAPVDGRHRWDWRFDDIVAAALARAGLTWLPILDYSAPWAQSIVGQDHSPPRSDVEYAAYARAFAARYGVGGSFWRAHPKLSRNPVLSFEIWNEPDNPQFWVPRPDPTAYAALYAAARAAIDAVDPGARVIVGGLTHPAAFLPAMLHADPALAGRIDGVAIHPYGPPRRVLARVTAARATLRAIGQGAVPLYVTEFGWTTAPPGTAGFAPAARRPGYVRRALAELRGAERACGIAAVVIYAWATPQRFAGSAGDWYGIHGPGDRAAQEAFAAGVRPGARGAPGPRTAGRQACGG